jgi:transcriptional repressor NrdR
MRCPYCASLDTQVRDSRPTDDASAIRRRRVCPDCGGRFTTFERVQLRELTVVKRSGRRVAVERLVNGLVRQLESLGEPEIASESIGALVMDGLKGLDDVAYVRFASVYKDFREVRDFEELIGTLGTDMPSDTAASSSAPLPPEPAGNT